MNNDEISCKNAYGDQIQSLHEDIILALKNRITHRLELITNSTFQLFSDKCRNMNNEFNGSTKEYYVHLKTDRNTDVFPWMNDYNDFIIKGLNNITGLRFFYEHNKKPRYQFLAKSGSIIWNVTTTKSRRIDFELNEFRLEGTISNHGMNDSVISPVERVAVKENDEYSESPMELLAQLNARISDGIERTTKSEYSHLAQLRLEWQQMKFKLTHDR